MKLLFRKKWLLFYPVSFSAWIMFAVYLAVNCYTIYRIAISYNSVYSSLIRYFPYFVCFTVVLFWIAAHYEEKRGN
jgi:hypothetical protein